MRCSRSSPIPNLADKKWVYRQYDHMVQINTVVLPGADAAVLRIKGQKRALAITLDGNSLYCQLDPRAGGRIAVAEACRNLACVGARPVGVTNCLNFGNPEKPEVMWQFEEAVEGLAEACRAFGIPVTGGNVSLYNDTEGASIHPTPVLGVVGMIKDVGRVVGPGFRKEGDIVVLLGETRDEIGGSQYLRIIHGLETGPVPALDLGLEKAVQEVCRRGRRAGPRPLGPRRLGWRPGRLRRRELDPQPRKARLRAGPRGGYPRRGAPFRREPVADRRQPGPVAPSRASPARGADTRSRSA